jgi:hypothetical protein
MPALENLSCEKKALIAYLTGASRGVCAAADLTTLRLSSDRLCWFAAI